MLKTPTILSFLVFIGFIPLVFWIYKSVTICPPKHICTYKSYYSDYSNTSWCLVEDLNSTTICRMQSTCYNNRTIGPCWIMSQSDNVCPTTSCNPLATASSAASILLTFVYSVISVVLLIKVYNKYEDYKRLRVLYGSTLNS